MSIIGYYCNSDNYNLAQISMGVLKYPHLDDSIYKNVISNYKFYSKSVFDWETASQPSFMEAVKDIGFDLMSSSIPEFVSSTPSVLKISDTEMHVNVRYVNYRVGEEGEYINGPTIETRNVLATLELSKNGVWEKTREVFMQHDRSEDNRYVGIEDVRLFSTDGEGGSLEYNGNRGTKNGNMVVEIGEVDAVSGKCTDRAIFMKIENQNSIEKNWVYFKDRKSAKKMIYGWSPLKIGDVSMDGVFSKTHEHKTPNIFKHVRGSTNGIVIGDEIWFLCHLVSYEERRYYYHLFVVLDADTYQVKKYTELFTFEKQKVEYSLGFAVMGDDLLIGYSLMDKCTKYTTIPKSRFDSIMVV